MNRRLVIIIGVLIASALAGGVWWSWRAPGPAAWQGYAEADYVKVAPTQQGLLMAVTVARGSRVEVGTPLFTQDEGADRAARDQAARQLQQACDQLSNLEAAAKPTEIQQAEANLADAQATVQRARFDLDRAEALIQSGAVTNQTLDQRRADFRSASAKVSAMLAMLTQMRAPTGRQGEIQAQQAAVDAAKAALAMADWRLSQRRVASPVDARVVDVLARPGETVAAGAPVVSLLPPSNIFVRFFVPEADLARVHTGDTVAIHCDRCHGDISATISFVSPQAEYTPPVIYSEESRAKLVYLVEARPPPAQAASFNPGQPVTVLPAGAKP